MQLLICLCSFDILQQVRYLFFQLLVLKSLTFQVLNHHSILLFSPAAKLLHNPVPTSTLQALQNQKCFALLPYFCRVVVAACTWC